ncbi:3'-5' exonuclease [Planktotalea arctica]|uniref:3'-5' exonuclease n=1 Tax=Planktotalea arctica TaxID=1481893 RepID=UPI000A16D4CC|nr:3'-5' exonuclease [Planktotalea arctica]
MNRFRHLQTIPDGPFRFIAIDVETANKSNASICQIGLCFVNVRNQLQTFSTLVNPEGPFDPFNTQIHGITSDMVTQAPNFADAYGALYAVLEDNHLARHSRFDERAFEAACARYEMSMVTSHWTNSVQVARKAWPEFKGAGGHGLAHLKKVLGLEFHHHDAGEDARASATVILLAEERMRAPLPHLKVERQLTFQFN